MGNQTMPPHQWRNLEDEALDQHLVAQHGWDVKGILARGAQFLASKGIKGREAMPWRAHALDHDVDPDKVQV